MDVSTGERDSSLHLKGLNDSGRRGAPEVGHCICSENVQQSAFDHASVSFRVSSWASVRSD